MVKVGRLRDSARRAFERFSLLPLRGRDVRLKTCLFAKMPPTNCRNQATLLYKSITGADSRNFGVRPFRNRPAF
jgi:hypothetical protein